ncbi:omega-amidase NIT2-like [Contarinia nasturtii]|uniref:omega-amidase NIT2-like n=1 Tax=Contarinia nasturtii TaxID=265458 RepID=UPI0012D3E4D4|nr:omega-amidase NIT2-like [Contarinia nasturtii]
MASCENTKLRICLLQFLDKGDLTQTLSHLEELVETAVKQHQPHIIALPECFTFAYETELPILNANAETIKDGKTCQTLSALAKKFNLHIVGGSIVERDGANLYNTATVWNEKGELIAKHRKVHLCDIHFKNESDIVEVNRFTPGENTTTFEINGIKCGVAICYDAFFDEFIKTYRKSACEVLFVPAAYDLCIGPPYWELFHRSRANDNQLFVAAISPARNEKSNYVIYGHSMIIDPTGKILTEAGIREEIIFHEIDIKVLQRVREALPLFRARRPEVYDKIK